MADRRWRWIPILVFLFALMLRLIYLAGQAAHNPLFNDPIMDMAVHHEWAGQFASGQPLRGIEGKPYFRAPLYYVTLGLVYKVFGAEVWIGRLLGCLLGAASCALIAQLGAVLSDRRVGLASGLIAAVYWPFLYYDAELKTVGMEVFFNLLMLLTMIRAVRTPAAWRFLLAGVFCGLSAITRPNILAVTPFLALWTWLMLRRGAEPRPAVMSVVMLAAGCALPILPVTLRNLIVGREFVLIASQGGVNFYIGNNPYNADGYTAVVPFTRPGWWEGFEDTHDIPQRELGRLLSEREISNYWFRKSWEWIRAHPGDWIRRLVHKFVLFWTPIEVSNNQPISFFAGMSGLSWMFWIGFPVVSALGIAGVIFIRRDWREWALPIGFLVLYMGTVVLFFCPGRYRLPVVPVLLVLTGKMVIEAAQHWRRKEYGSIGAAGLIVALVGVASWLNPTPDADRELTRRVESAEGHSILASHFSTAGADGRPRNLQRAREHLEKAISLRPDDAYLHWRMGWILAALNDDAGAEDHFRDALRFARADPEPAFQYGRFLASRKRWKEAIAAYESALRIQPAYREVPPALAYAQKMLRDSESSDESVEQYRAILQQRPDDVDALIKLGAAQIRRDHPAEAIGPLEQAVRLAPMRDDGIQALAEAYRRTGRYADAIASLRAAEQHGNNPVLLTALAWLLATAPQDDLRDGARALELLRRAQNLTPQPVPQILDALAAALAETGDFTAATHTARQAADLAQHQGKPVLADQIRGRLQVYEQGRPFREPRQPPEPDRPDENSLLRE